MKVLIVDDSVYLRQSLKNLLLEIESVDTVWEAKNVNEGAVMTRIAHPDVIFLDVKLPDGSYLDVLAAAKKENPSPFIIIFTNHPYPQYKKQSMAAGADLFLDKAMDYEQIPVILNSYAQKTENV